MKRLIGIVVFVAGLLGLVALLPFVVLDVWFPGLVFIAIAAVLALIAGSLYGQEY